MREQTVWAKIADNKISAEVHAESLDHAIEMFMEIAEAICTQAERAKLTTKEICGSTLSYLLAEKYASAEATEVIREALDTRMLN